MAENIVINNTTPSSNSGGSSGLIGLVKPIATLIAVVTLIVLIFGLVLLVENWEAVTIFFTCGFVGWLNPFDSSDCDTGPIETVIGPGGGRALRFIPVIGPVLSSLSRIR